MTNERIATEIKANGDPTGKLRLQLLEMNRGYIRSFWRQYSAVISESELESISFISVSEACCLFDQERGAFLQVLSWSLQKELAKAMADASSGIHFSSRLERDVRTYSKAVRDYYSKHGEMPSNGQILDMTGFCEEYLAEIKTAYTARMSASLDAPVSQDQDTDITLADTIPDTVDVAEEITAKCFADQLTEFITEILQTLPDAERVVINLRFYDRQTVKSTAKALDISPQEARRTEARALKALQRNSRLRAFYEETNVFHHTGLTPFLTWQGSQPERAVIRILDDRRREDV